MRALVPEKRPDTANDHAATAARRANEIVASLRAGDATDVFDTFWQLDALPVDEVREAFTAWVGPLPDPYRLDPARRQALGLPPPPLTLTTIGIAKDADVLDLGPVAEEQLRLAGKSWDGADLAPEERLDGEIEGSFAGTLERRVLADASAPGAPLFDVVLFAEDSGIVFAAGTTNVVAMIAYGKVEMRDRRARVAIEAALAAPSETPAQDPAPSVATPFPTLATAPAPRAESTAKKAPAKAIAKKAPAKAAARKTTTKKATSKKALSKKSPAKVTSKKATLKKATAKKTTPKKKTPKKKTAPRTVAKKPAAKRTTKARTVAAKATKR